MAWPATSHAAGVPLAGPGSSRLSDSVFNGARREPTGGSGPPRNTGGLRASHSVGSCEARQPQSCPQETPRERHRGSFLSKLPLNSSLTYVAWAAPLCSRRGPLLHFLVFRDLQSGAKKTELGLDGVSAPRERRPRHPSQGFGLVARFRLTPAPPPSDPPSAPQGPPSVAPAPVFERPFLGVSERLPGPGGAVPGSGAPKTGGGLVPRAPHPAPPPPVARPPGFPGKSQP